MKDESAPDGRPYSLQLILTLTVQAYTESLLNDENAPYGRPYSL